MWRWIPVLCMILVCLIPGIAFAAPTEVFTINATGANFTAGPPYVVNENATDISTTTATLNGNITDDGGVDCDYRGFVWDDESHGYPGNTTAPADSSYEFYWTELGSFNEGTYSRGISSLTHNTTYWFRPVVHNSEQWTYGDELSFNTTMGGPEPPEDFVVTYISDNELELTWALGQYAENTLVRGAIGRCPEDRNDGYLVYYGSGTNATDWVRVGVDLDICYVAWSEGVDGQWSNPVEARGNYVSSSFLFFGFIVLAFGLTFLSYKRPHVLVSMGAGLSWLAMGFWLLIGDIDNLDISDSWVTILVWVFIMMTFVPFLFQMDTFITWERKGTKWTGWGPKPEDEKGPESYEQYKEELRRRLGGKK